MNHAYRAPDVAVERKLEAQGDDGPSIAAARYVYVRRVARAGAGLVGLGFAVAAFLDAAVDMLADLGGRGSGTIPPGQLTHLLLWGWLAERVALA